MWERIITKATSGKFIFTIVAAIAFLYCVVARILPPDKIYDVISIVIVAYFVKGNNGIPKP